MEKLFLFKTEYLKGYLDIKYSFDREDLLSIVKVKPEVKSRKHFYEIEDKLENIDDRRYMWD